MLAICFACLTASPVAALDATEGGTSGDAAAVFSIVVEGERIAPSPSKFVAILDVDQMLRAGAVTVGDALRLSPDVSIVEYGAWGRVKSVGVRGAGSEQALVLVDGHPVPDGLQSVLSLPLTGIDRIEILRPPAALVHGADAGTINVITAAAAAREGTRAVSADGFPERSLTVSEGRVEQGRAYSLAAGHAAQTGPSLLDSERYLDMRWEWELSPKVERLFQVTWRADEHDAPEGAEVAGPGVGAFTTYAGIDFTHLQDVASGTLAISAFARRTDEGERADLDELRAFDLKIGSSVQGDFALESGELSIGLTAEHERFASDRHEPGEHGTERAAAYAVWEYDASDTLRLSAGARAQADTRFGISVSPQVGVELETGSEMTWRAAATHVVRTPSWDDLYWKGQGDPNLRPEKGWRLEIGAERELPWGVVNLSVFGHQLRDRIVWSDDGTGLARPANVAQSVAQGIDLVVRAPLGGGFETSVGWTLHQEVDASSGAPIEVLPEQQTRFGLTYEGEGTRGNFVLQLMRSWSGSGSPFQAVASGRFSRAASKFLDLFAEGVNLFDAKGMTGDGPGSAIPGRRLMVGASLIF